MSDKYWNLYDRVIYQERYYWLYRDHAARIDKWIKIFLLAVSLANVASLSVWKHVPMVWAIIACIAQIMSAASYLFVQDKQVTALNYLLPELQALQNRLDHEWERIQMGELSDGKINDLIFDANNQLVAMENKYLNGIPFPEKESLRKQAIKETSRHKYSYLDVTQTDYLEEVLNHDK